MSRLLDFCVGVVWGGTIMSIGILIKQGYTTLEYLNLMFLFVIISLIYTMFCWEKKL